MEKIKTSMQMNRRNQERRRLTGIGSTAFNLTDDGRHVVMALSDDRDILLLLVYWTWAVIYKVVSPCIRWKLLS